MTKSISSTLTKNSPHILTGLGCAGVISTAVLTGRAVPKALTILEEEKTWRKNNNFVEMTKIDVVKNTWTVFIPAIAVGSTTIACIIGANTVNTRRNAAIAALYTMSETAFRDYKGKVVEQVGQIKEARIRDEVAKDLISNNERTIGDKTVIVTGNGNVKCYDVLSDRYFESSYEFIRQKVNDLNYRLLSEMWLDLNDLYYELGLGSTGLGSQVGFDIEKGQIEIEYSTQLDPQGMPCLVFTTNVSPKYVE